VQVRVLKFLDSNSPQFLDLNVNVKDLMLLEEFLNSPQFLDQVLDKFLEFLDLFLDHYYLAQLPLHRE
jgi:hypothetical protein